MGMVMPSTLIIIGKYFHKLFLKSVFKSPSCKKCPKIVNNHPKNSQNNSQKNSQKTCQKTCQKNSLKIVRKIVRKIILKIIRKIVLIIIIKVLFVNHPHLSPTNLKSKSFACPPRKGAASLKCWVFVESSPLGRGQFGVFRPFL